MRRMKTAKCRMSFVRFAGYRGKQAKILSDGSLEDLLPQFCGDVESVKLPEQCAGEGPKGCNSFWTRGLPRQSVQGRA